MAEELTARFVTALQRGVEGEIAAMEAQSVASEAALARGEDLGGGRYAFDALARDPLVAGTACTLRGPGGSQRATIERVEGTRVVLALEAGAPALDVSGGPFSISTAPWFLYERLVQALGSIDAATHHVDTALMLFGKGAPARVATPLRGEHAALNESQRAAVTLCAESALAFVWGPPGTGKTVTLASVIEELLAQGQRILLASTTNAAIDQVLAKLATRPWFAGSVAAGATIRLGRSDAETYGAELADVVERLDTENRVEREGRRARIAWAQAGIREGQALVERLAEAAAPQRSLFAEPEPSLPASAFAALFGAGLAELLARLPARAQRERVGRRVERLERLVVLARARTAELAAAARELEARLAREARLVMCTLTNAYLSPLVAGERFDVLVAEEAGMATLPPLFFAASLCRARAIMVGDPRQLPPIVQADDAKVRRAIGRTIFEVTVPDPERSPLVALLESQYRMHPAIGELVGGVFYGGRLVHRADAAALAPVTAGAPFPGEALVVVDTGGRTQCERAANGRSRVNPGSAALTVELAAEAAGAGSASIGIITPYAAQVGELRKRLAARGLGDVVDCSTIHRFQGRECDVVILDLVDAAPMRPSALLAEAPNLMNVSLSRARAKLIIVADVAYFEATAPEGIVARILRAARGGGGAAS